MNFLLHSLQSWAGVFGAGQRDPVKLGRARKVREKFGTNFCVFFDCYCQSLISGRETGRWAISPPKF